MRQLPLALLAAAVLLAPAAVLAQQACPTSWTVEETLRIGSVDGAVPLTSVQFLVLGPEGELYVDQMGSEIFVFSGSGDSIGTRGGPGQGPGDFEGATTGLGLKGDTLRVSEGRGTHFFGRDGSFMSRVVFQAPFIEEEGVQYRPSVPLADGTFLLQWTIFDPEPISAAPEDRIRDYFVRFHAGDFLFQGPTMDESVTE